MPGFTLTKSDLLGNAAKGAATGALEGVIGNQADIPGTGQQESTLGQLNRTIGDLDNMSQKVLGQSLANVLVSIFGGTPVPSRASTVSTTSLNLKGGGAMPLNLDSLMDTILPQVVKNLQKIQPVYETMTLAELRDLAKTNPETLKSILKSIFGGQ